jgi:hypothetical protein
MPNSGESSRRSSGLVLALPLFSAPHYENLAAYQYDGIPPELRLQIRQLSPRVEIGMVAKRD